MTVKLTLSIDKQTIERAKVLSSKRGKSISKIVEEYLDSIAPSDEKKESVVDQLAGVLKNKVPANVDWKDIKADHLKKKYGC